MNTLIVNIELFLETYYISFIYIVSFVVFICIILLYLWRWRDYLIPCRIAKKSKQPKVDVTECEWPKLSVIVPAFDQAGLLAKNLPLLLEQDYPNFEVIVVDEASTDDTSAIVKQMQLRYRNLRCTFVPSTADICKRKLAITLGVRAARSEWAVITTASAFPRSQKWLKHMASQIDEECDVILGYASYINEGSPYSYRAIYERLFMQLRCYRSALGLGSIGGDETNFCIRKSAFLEHKGYADKLQNDFGESHLLIETLAQKNNTRLAICPEATMVEELPLELVWKNTRICYRETLMHASKRTYLYLLREGAASFLIYLLIFCVLSYISLRGFQIGILKD